MPPENNEPRPAVILVYRRYDMIPAHVIGPFDSSEDALFYAGHYAAFYSATTEDRHRVEAVIVEIERPFLDRNGMLPFEG